MLVRVRLTARATFVVALTISGCAPSLSTFQPAHVAPRGRIAASVGLEGGVPTGAFTSLVDAGKALAARGQNGEALSDDDKWRIFDAGVNLALTLPSFGPHLLIGYTPADHLEVSVRYAGSAWRLGARYQLLDHDTGPFDFTVGLGVSRFAFAFPISDQIPVLKLDDFSRWQLDVPILVGTSRDWFHVWAGPKILLTTFSTEMTLSLPGDVTVARFDGTAGAFGAQGGFAIGYRRMFVAFELTLAEAFGTAHLSAVGLAPPTHDAGVSSFTIFPSVGLMGEL
ncbi:MAG TPA: hypothetical protein VHJ20_10765 [Polyangia bacterium]|nr:hypothetical protein [Polyangia bacterium]